MSATIRYMGQEATRKDGEWLSKDVTFSGMLNSAEKAFGAFWSHGGDPDPDYSNAVGMVKHLKGDAVLIAHDPPPSNDDELDEDGQQPVY